MNIQNGHSKPGSVDFDTILYDNFCFSERYQVDEVQQDSREDCYKSTFHINDVDVHDSRPYYLVVENERGIDRHSINLIVEGMFTGALNILSFHYH